MNILTNYTNAQRVKFIQKAQKDNKRIEIYNDSLYALAENEIIKNGEIIIDNNRLNKIQQQNFEKEFFETSLGYVRRNVTMKDGSSKNFLTDILPLLQAGIKIITYSTNDFVEVQQNREVIVTDEFLLECKQQLLKDFYGG